MCLGLYRLHHRSRATNSTILDAQKSLVVPIFLFVIHSARSVSFQLDRSAPSWLRICLPSRNTIFPLVSTLPWMPHHSVGRNGTSCWCTLSQSCWATRSAHVSNFVLDYNYLFISIYREALHPSKWPFAIVYIDDLPQNAAEKPWGIKLASRLGIRCPSLALLLWGQHAWERSHYIPHSSRIRCFSVFLPLRSLSILGRRARPISLLLRLLSRLKTLPTCRRVPSLSMILSATSSSQT